MVRQKNIVPNNYAVPNKRNYVVFSRVSRCTNIEKRSQGLFGIICSRRSSGNAVFQQVADIWIFPVADDRGRLILPLLLEFFPALYLARPINIKSGCCDSLLIRIVVDQNGSVVLKAGILEGFKLCSHAR